MNAEDSLESPGELARQNAAKRNQALQSEAKSTTKTNAISKKQDTQ